MDSDLNQNVDFFKCKLCFKEIIKSRMRLHIGFHVLNGDTLPNANLCGFCGLVDGCNVELVTSSGFGKSKTLGPKSNCSYFFTFSLKPASKGSIRSPCTNRPIICEICNECIWSYNINYHYQSKHNLNDVPNELKITEKLIKHSKFNLD